ncbi:MAG: NAD(P)H-dependent oxidoreductase subunit E [Ilumatobacteraceae bacterium]
MHLAQEQDGYLTDDAIRHVAELVGATSAEVLGTATFYEMFKFEPVGTYLINICGTMSCALMGAGELMRHAEQTLGIPVGGTTPDGMFTLEHAECQAACTEAPCLQVNYRHRFRVTPADLDRLVEDLRRPSRRRDPAARHAGAGAPVDSRRVGGRCGHPEQAGAPAWFPAKDPA